MTITMMRALCEVAGIPFTTCHYKVLHRTKELVSADLGAGRNVPVGGEEDDVPLGIFGGQDYPLRFNPHESRRFEISGKDCVLANQRIRLRFNNG